ncbi:glycoside hydrolase family 28 protein [Acidisoma sp.]|uniref:rhamnogalacturonidase n=1 Tax=Acidisoma sp. TaxID=1872115 RepID=UPI003B004EB2
MTCLDDADTTRRHGPVSRDRPFDVRAFGAVGDGRTIDSGAINRAIEAASRAGGGTVLFPAGRYASYSIRLRSRVRLHLDRDAVILAADASDRGGYDLPEDSIAAQFPYQDFGHSHWRNSLISGIDLHDIAIEGQGLIWGRGLVNGDFEPGRPPAMQPGIGNKAIALLGCRNVVLKDFSILQAGHFAVLATGTIGITAEGLRIDTNRDGLNFDCCRDVRVVRCRINSPNDDGICLKSTYALGRPVVTEDVLIADCWVTGDYELGSTLDGSYRPLGNPAHANVTHRTGRIKLGTESNGGFRKIVMTNNVLQSCRGLALETVDGGILEDVRIQGLTMRDVRHAPIYIRLGARLNGPSGAVPGKLRGVSIRDVDCEQRYSSMPIIVSGIPGHRIEDVEMRDIRLRLKGGCGAKMAAIVPPEAVASYPDPESFGVDLPACGLFARHVKGLDVRRFRVECMRPDLRPAAWLQDIAGGRVFIERPAGVRARPLVRRFGDVRALGSRSDG